MKDDWAWKNQSRIVECTTVHGKNSNSFYILDFYKTFAVCICVSTACDLHPDTLQFYH